MTGFSNGFLKNLIELSFDRDFYLGQFIDKPSPTYPLGHYLSGGWREGFDPAPWFSTPAYLDLHPEILKIGANPFIHYLTAGRVNNLDSEIVELLSAKEASVEEPLSVEEVEASEVDKIRPFFDSAWYSAQLDGTDLVAPADLAKDYYQHGWRQGLDPNPNFSTQDYLSDNPDVASSQKNPFVHFIIAGKDEGRPVKESKARPFGDTQEVATSPQPTFEIPSPSGPDVESAPEALEQDPYEDIRRLVEPHFDEDFYLQTYPDVAGSEISALRHFLVQGWCEGRNPNAAFSVSAYLEDHPEVAEEGTNAFYHYLLLNPTGSKS